MQVPFADYLRAQRARGNVGGCFVFLHLYKVQKRYCGSRSKHWNEKEEIRARGLQLVKWHRGRRKGKTEGRSCVQSASEESARRGVLDTCVQAAALLPLGAGLTSAE